MCHVDVFLSFRIAVHLIILFFLSSSSSLGHKAKTMFLHRVLSLAAAYASPDESPISSNSAITVLWDVVFGRPGFLLPGGVHLRATLGILSLCILRTCLSHVNRWSLISRTALLQPIFLWVPHYTFLGPYYTVDLSQASIVEGTTHSALVNLSPHPPDINNIQD